MPVAQPLTSAPRPDSADWRARLRACLNVGRDLRVVRAHESGYPALKTFRSLLKYGALRNSDAL